tara:strand:- start:652 stop:1077 length:426 start_codon:yes stop_codon:yes gene_type:complete
MWKSLNLARVIETLLLIIFLVLIDQCMKVFISKIMLNNSFKDMQLLPFLNIVFVRNTGVSFGMFSEWGILGRYFFSIFSIVVGCFLILLAIFSDGKVFRSSLALISSGALGNAIDRVYFGGVIDFIDFFIYNFHWPAFKAT